MTDRDTSRDVAIIGMACRFANSDDTDAFWTNLVEGRQCFREIGNERWNHDAFASERFREKDKTYVKRGAFIDDVDSFGAMHFGIAPRRVQVMDPQHRMVLETTRIALLDAGIEDSRDDLETMGTFLGVSTSEYRNFVTSRTLAMMMASGTTGEHAGAGEAISESVKNVAPISAFSMPGVLMNMAAANVANHWKLGGPAYTVDAACASSLLAVHDAVTHIRAGICRTAVAGGVYVNLTPEAIVGFSRIGAISQKGDCRPFDADADGFLQGDGCGVVVLKSLDDAIADGDRIYAVVRGTGVNNDAGQSSGPMAPSLEGQKGAIRAAVKDASVAPSSIGFVSCHGTATPVGDPVEVGALRDVLTSDQAPTEPVRLGSVKGNFGHTMSAAGVAGFMHAVLALHHEKITPQAGYATPHPDLELGDGIVEVPTEAIGWPRGDAPRRAGVSAFGFGGTNVHVVLEESPVDASTDVPQHPHAVVLRADSRELLADYAELLAADVGANEADLETIAFTLSATRRSGVSRMAVVADTKEELAKTLRRVAPQLRGEDAPGAMLGPNAFFGEGDSPGLAFMFPGQGAQRLGLFRALTERYPTFAAHLERLGAAADLDIRELLYPDHDNDEAAARLTATEICQPVMAAVGLALAAFLRELGVEPDVCFGHSLGEFAAAAAGGMMSDEDAVRFVAERGRLMAALEVDDFGAMAAVMAAPAKVEAHLVEGAQVANLNHPTQTVISGATDAVEQTAASLEAADVKVTMLRVSHAFHSSVVAPVKEGLAKVVAELPLNEPTTPVISAITGSPYDDVAGARTTFVEHTTSAVNFMNALDAASEHARLFLEVGAGGTLCAFAKGSLDELHAARSLGSKTEDDGREFQRALALLAASGFDVAFERLYVRRRVTSLVAAPLRRTRHWVIRDKEAALDVPESSLGGAILKNDQKTDANPDLVALFREQNEILRQHAAIIAAQTAALGGTPISSAPTLEAQAPAAPADLGTQLEPGPQVTDPQVESVPAEEPPATDYADLVRDAVAAVSAFPMDALTDDQQLAIDLGFDSLMFVDLASDLQKRVPGLEIPQAAFDQSTSIGDVIAFLEENAGDADGASDTPIELGDVQRFAVQWQPVRPLDLAGEPFKPSGTVAITTTGVDDEALLLAQTLEKRGVTTRLIDLDDTTDIGDATTLIHLGHRDHGWDLDQLVTLRNLAAQLQANGPEAFVTVTSAGAEAATIGAQRGFAKALGREWSDARAVGAFIDDNVAATLLAELDDARHFAEVRWEHGARHVTAATPAEADGKLSIDDDDVVVVTGGAKGIARACVDALAQQTKAKFILVGRSKKADLGDLKGRATYVSWDVATSNPKAFGDAKPTVVVHAAGVIRDAAVQKKTSDDVRLVAGVKVDGLRHVLEAAGDSVHTVVGFGSWAGRFGNAHQCDYAAANDAMTELLRELASAGTRAVNIDWPVWDDSSMGDSIPQALKDAMLARGVTFLSTEEGTLLFLDELGAAQTGEVLYARTMPVAKGVFSGRYEASLDTMPYVADHVVRGVPIVPLAGALDFVATAATGATDSAVAVSDLTLFKGLDLSKPKQLDIRATDGTAEIHADGELAYRAKFRAVEDVDLEALSPELRGDAVTPKLDLAHFYSDVAFHGPRIQGITEVEGIAPEWIVGLVKTSTPESLGVKGRDHWTIDPLVVDAAMQLVLYHLKSLHGFGAIPMGIDEYVQVRPFEGDWVRCSMALDDMSDGNIVGTIAFEDEQGLAAVMTRLRAKEFHDDKPAAEPKIEVDPKHWDISQWTEVNDLEQRLQMADLIGIRNPYFWTHDGPARNTAIIEGTEMLNYSSYNYCGFSGHPEVSQAAKDAVERYGTSVSASRIASGQIPLHQELEDAISSFIGTEATLVFSAGHMTNETVIGHVFGKNDLIIHDALAHNSILTGAELSGAKRMSFPHSDWEALDRTLTKLRGNFEKVGIFIEGVYSMDGDIPDLQKFIDVKNKHRALLYVDEAHSMGVIGPRGAGIADYYGIDPMEVDMWMGTLSKSFASCGGYITGSKQLINYLKYTTPAFVFSAGISPANAAAACASAKLLAKHPEIPQTLQKRADYFVELCKQHGIDTGMSKDSAVVPAIVGNSIECLKLSANLAERGVNVQPIVYPAVDDDASRLRFFLSAVHTEENLRTTVEILAEELANVRQSGAAAE